MENADSADFEGPFRVGDWTVNPTNGRITRSGTEVRLEPKVMSVLVLLAQHRGEAISREEIEATVWPDVVVSYDALSTTIIKLRKALGDDSRNPDYIETVSKKGYRLIATVSSAEQTEAQAATIEVKQKPVRTIPVSILAVSGIFILVVVSWIVFSQFLSENGFDTDSPTVVVLPFTNLSNNPEQEYLSDGITEDLITDLSQVSGLIVRSRTSSYIFKGKKVDIADVANTLDARYVIEGSVRKAGDQIRISVKLIDSQTNKNLWADRYDRAYQEIFAVQDEVTRKIVDVLAIELSIAEKERLTHAETDNLAAYDMFQRGQQYFHQRTREAYDLATDAYRQAIEHDPKYARAYGALAVILTHQSRRGWTPLSRQEALNRALELAQTAVALDRASPQTYWALGFVYLFRKEYENATTAVEQAIAISPNYADGYGLLAFINNWQGKGELAEKHIKKAIALNPYHTFDYPFNLAFAYYNQGQYEKAIEWITRSLERNESALVPRIFLVSCYVKLNRLDEAEWEVEQVLIQRPSTTSTLLLNDLAFEQEFRRTSILEDLEKAGMPE